MRYGRDFDYGREFRPRRRGYGRDYGPAFSETPGADDFRGGPTPHDERTWHRYGGLRSDVPQGRSPYRRRLAGYGEFGPGGGAYDAEFGPPRGRGGPHRGQRGGRRYDDRFEARYAGDYELLGPHDALARAIERENAGLVTDYLREEWERARRRR